MDAEDPTPHARSLWTAIGLELGQAELSRRFRASCSLPGEAGAGPRLTVGPEEPGHESPRKDKAAATQPTQPAVTVAVPRKRTPLQRWRSRLFRSLWTVCLVTGVLAILGRAVGGGVFFVVIG